MLREITRRATRAACAEEAIQGQESSSWSTNGRCGTRGPIAGAWTPTQSHGSAALTEPGAPDAGSRDDDTGCCRYEQGCAVQIPSGRRNHTNLRLRFPGISVSGPENL